MRSSSSSCVHQHVRPFAGAQCNKRHSISMTTRRRHKTVVVSASFSVSDITGPVNDTVNDLKSAEVRIHYSPIIFFVIILSSSSRELHDKNDEQKRFTFRCAEDHLLLLLQFFSDQKTTSPPTPRARFRAKEKKGGGEEEEEEEENPTVWTDLI